MFDNLHIHLFTLLKVVFENVPINLLGIIVSLIEIHHPNVHPIEGYFILNNPPEIDAFLTKPLTKTSMFNNFFTF